MSQQNLDYQWFEYQMAKLSSIIASEVNVHPEVIADIVERFVSEIEQRPINVVATTQLLSITDKLKDM
jgi:hypothetical protein